MVFSSLGFLYLFLPAVLIVYYLMPATKNNNLRNAVLLLFSMAFYYVGEQRLVILMVISTLVDYTCGRLIGEYGEKTDAGGNKVRRVWLCRLALGISLVFNLGLLAYFKYADMLIGLFNTLTGTGLPLLKIALPIGISFYTFQTMSYTIDVYRGDVKAQKNLLTFACYVTIFPQLIAGPIVRYSEVEKQLETRRFDLTKMTEGIHRFCLGLAKKVLLADQLASFIQIADTGNEKTLLLVWASAIALPLQIYFDFSGYSDMAIGLGAMFGFSFPENFNYPMASRSATEFWRRWHMTLGGWFRDYLYIPLGGNRVNKCRLVLNLLVVWAATGLWHGSEWHFILWGLYYGVLIILEKFLMQRFFKSSSVYVRILNRVYFFFVTVVGFQIFGAEDLFDLGVRLSRMVGVGTTGFSSPVTSYYLRNDLTVLILGFFFSFPALKTLLKKLGKTSVAQKTLADGSCLGERVRLVAASLASLVALLLVTAFLIDGSYSPFLYFRF